MKDATAGNGMDGAAFAAAAGRRQRSSFLAASLIILVFSAFIVIMAFRPLWFAPASADGGVTEIGMLLALLFILANCAVMWAYVRWRGNRRRGRGTTEI